MSHRGRATKNVKMAVAKELHEVPEIVAFLEKIFPETGLGEHFEWSRERAMKSIANLAISGSGYLFYAYANSKAFSDKPLRDKIVGVMILGEEVSWFSDESYFVNVAYYVVPKYRKLGIPQNLLHLAKSWTKSLGKSLVLDFRNTNKEFLPKMVKYGEINKFKHIGASMIYS